jgi:lipoprotein-anchoring transpeptidase ErfK/SrfK
MLRNNYLVQMAMLLCFGTAILSIAMQWSANSSMTYESNSTRQNNAGNGVALAQKASLVKQSRQLYARNSQFSLAASSNGMRVIVDLSDRRVYVYRNNLVVASYPTGIGKDGWETPLGTFQVQRKQLNPIWQHPITGKVFPPGPDSPLGERWIGFWTDGRDHVGFHGTPEIELVGSAVSHGCLRMRNPDVKMLYQQVKVGTPVEVRP